MLAHSLPLYLGGSCLQYQRSPPGRSAAHEPQRLTHYPPTWAEGKKSSSRQLLVTDALDKMSIVRSLFTLFLLRSHVSLKFSRASIHLDLRIDYRASGSIRHFTEANAGLQRTLAPVRRRPQRLRTPAGAFTSTGAPLNYSSLIRMHHAHLIASSMFFLGRVLFLVFIPPPPPPQCRRLSLSLPLLRLR